MSKRVSRSLLAIALLQFLLWASAASAQEPQELEQLEPGRHELQFEYQSLVRMTDGDAGDTHSLSVAYGVSDRLALGLELQGERVGATFAVDTLDLSALYHFAALNEGSLKLGMKVSAGLNRHGQLAQAEVRLIAEQIGSEWWLQGNIIAEHERANGSRNFTLAYIANASHNLVSNIWLGVEVSGSMSGLAGTAEGERGHFIGPSASVEYDFSKSADVEVGAVYLARIAGTGPANSVRLFVQINFH